MTTAAEQLAAEILKSETVEVDGQKITRRKLSELIEAAKYERQVAATANPFGCLQVRKLVPGGGG